MHSPATMRLCNNAILAVLLSASTLTLWPQQAPSKPAQAPSLTEDRDPVRSPDAEPPVGAGGPLKKEGEGYILRTNVE